MLLFVIMGFTIYQVNIQNFIKNKYALAIDVSHYNADIIFLNETGTVKEKQLKLAGYKSMGIKNIANDGMAIFIKYHFQIEYLHFPNNDLLAVKIFTNLGPIILATAYAPPRHYSLPDISLAKLFSHNCPVLFIGDLNARHYILNNLPPGAYPNSKGNQIHNTINRYNLKILGPNFHTFITARHVIR